MLNGGILPPLRLQGPKAKETLTFLEAVASGDRNTQVDNAAMDKNKDTEGEVLHEDDESDYIDNTL